MASPMQPSPRSAPRHRARHHQLPGRSRRLDGRPARLRATSCSRVVEQAVASDVHVRGNEITITGARRRQRHRRPPLRGAASRWSQAGQHAHARRGPARPSPCCTADTDVAPGRRAELNILSRRGKTIRPKTLNQKRYVDAIDQHTIVVRHRPGRHRQDLPGRGQGRAGAAGQAGQPHHPDPPGGRGGGAARASCPARSTTRSTPTCGRCYDALHDMLDPESIPRLTAGRHDRGRAAGLHARPHRSTTRSSSSTRRRTPRPSR